MAGYANPFDPQSSDTPWTEDFWLNSDPDAAFMKYLQSMGGYMPNSAGTRYAQNQQGRVYNEYKAKAAEDPNMGFYDYLKQNRPDLQGEFMAQAPEQRGDFSSRLLTPRARWAAG